MKGERFESFKRFTLFTLLRSYIQALEYMCKKDFKKIGLLLALFDFGWATAQLTPPPPTPKPLGSACGFEHQN